MTNIIQSITLSALKRGCVLVRFAMGGVGPETPGFALPPGRLKLATRPYFTGSTPLVKMHRPCTGVHRRVFVSACTVHRYREQVQQDEKRDSAE